MKEVKRRNFKKIFLVLSVSIFASYSSYSQYTLATTKVEDGLTKSQKLTQLIESPVQVLEKFGSKQYYMPSLGQFCIWEEKLTKTAKRPIKIRLGDHDYVDKLENKGN